ncbi:MAG: universal stress protein [Gammaproteobacteria bacterium]|nr:universal stress protein [Gammaproteobacteria bacterium]
MRVILVPVANRPECTNALKVAFKLANKLGASLSGCHIRAHSYSNVGLPDTSESKAAAAKKDKQLAKNGAAAKKLFTQIAEGVDYPLVKKPSTKPGAYWFEKVGSPDKMLSILGPMADLIVVSRPTSKKEKPALAFMLAALLNSSRPVLVLPKSRKSEVGRRISIAWNQSAEAAQAVAAAMPLLQAADAVNIITCGPDAGGGPNATQLANYLKFWGVKTTRSKTKGNKDVKEILQAYEDFDSDLLVMGAYSRSRLRQLIFGGVTEYMLRQANIPVFMLHS